MSSLWASIQGQEKPATAVVNDELVEVSDPVRGAPVKAPKHIAFKPVDSNMTLEMISEEITAPLVEELASLLEQHGTEVAHAFDVSDLIAEDRAPVAGQPGRPRVFKNNAQRQKAYRLRQKFGDLL